MSRWDQGMFKARETGQVGLAVLGWIGLEVECKGAVQTSGSDVIQACDWPE